MAKSELFPRMPRVDYEPLDRRLRLTPEYYGKHTVVLGCMDVDGHGYLNPDTDARDYAKKFVKPGTVLKIPGQAKPQQEPASGAPEAAQ